MHTMIGIMAYEDSEAQAKKAIIKIGPGITNHYKFDYGVLLDKKATIVFGETYIKHELVLFDRLRTEAKEDALYTGFEYGMKRVGVVFKGLGVKANPIISFEIKDAYKVLSFLLDKDEDMPDCPPSVFGPDATPIRSPKEFVQKARFNTKKIPYLVLMDVHFGSSIEQLEHVKKTIDPDDVEKWIKLRH